MVGTDSEPAVPEMVAGGPTLNLFPACVRSFNTSVKEWLLELINALVRPVCIFILLARDRSFQRADDLSAMIMKTLLALCLGLYTQ